MLLRCVKCGAISGEQPSLLSVPTMRFHDCTPIRDAEYARAAAATHNKAGRIEVMKEWEVVEETQDGAWVTAKVFVSKEAVQTLIRR